MLNARCQSLIIKSIILIISTSLLGCSSPKSSFEFQQLKKISNNLCNVAVLPLVDSSDYPQGGTVFYRIFVSQLIKNTTLNVVQEGDVRKVLRQLKIPISESPTFEQVLILADRLGLDAVVSGKIVIMEEKTGSLKTEPRIAVDIRLIDAVTGNTILTSYKNKSGNEYRKVMHFGLVNNITELASLVSEEIILKWKEEGVTGCGEL